jgi:ParB-like chromosome segregation protein Spo0J
MSRAELAMAFAVGTVERVQEAFELTLDEIAGAVGASRRTVSRWLERASVPSSTHRRNLERLNQLQYLLETSFRNRQAAQAWLHRSLPALKGSTPLYALSEGEMDAVVGVLATLAAGAHR